MRKLFGKGTPRSFAGVFSVIFSAAEASKRLWSPTAALIRNLGGSVVRARPAQAIFAAA